MTSLFPTSRAGKGQEGRGREGNGKGNEVIGKGRKQQARKLQ